MHGTWQRWGLALAALALLVVPARASAANAPPPGEFQGDSNAAVSPGTLDGIPGIRHVWEIPNSPYTPNDPVVALTFDDGPNPTYTPQVLDVLNQYGAPATFFDVGYEVAATPDLVRSEAAIGSVGNHTWDHVDLTKLPASGYPGEVDRTTDLLQQTTGQTVYCTRPPYGATNDSVISNLAARGQSAILWSVDTNDWRLPGVDAIVNNALSGLGNGAIVIMHDGGGNRSETVAALPRIIQGIRDRGYRLVPICGQSRNPFGNVDTVDDVGGGIHTAGWAIDPDTYYPIDVHVYVDGSGTPTSANVHRPDVDAAYHYGADHGFDATIGASPGLHNVCIYAINALAGTGNTSLGCRTVNVTPAAVGHLDSVRFVPGQGLRVTGWAADFDAPWTAEDVHVYVGGTGFDIGPAALKRPDVDKAFAYIGPYHGFDVTIPFDDEGSFATCAYAINIGRGVTNPQIGCLPTALPYEPVGSLDKATFIPGQGVRIQGWIADPDALTDPIDLRAWVNGTYYDLGEADGDRPDVAAALPWAGAAHGFDVVVPYTAEGNAPLCAIAVNVGRGASDTTAGCRYLSLHYEPIGHLDSVSWVPGKGIRVTGWAADPDALTDPIDVHLYVDGFGYDIGLANVDRPDIAAAFPWAGGGHGFDVIIPASSANRAVCGYGINVGRGAGNTTLGCAFIPPS